MLVRLYGVVGGVVVVDLVQVPPVARLHEIDAVPGDFGVPVMVPRLVADIVAALVIVVQAPPVGGATGVLLS